MLTLETIQTYLPSGEDSFVKFKRDDVHPNSLARELVAFANTRYFENIRYVDRLGRGIPMISREMRKMGRREPIIEADEGKVCLTLFRV
ncbi:MAG: hypothetical protein O7E52_28415 [Candidatus Poribacteria bacterium]|nr:hypothetical protein [Candidatus Poribacteria bacterium]